MTLDPGTLLWGGAWLLTMALSAAICFAQREWLFELSGLPESERKPIYATLTALGLFFGALFGYWAWPPFLALAVGWLLHPLLRPWLNPKAK